MVIVGISLASYADVRGVMDKGAEMSSSVARAWAELLGWGCIEAFLEGAKFVGVDSLVSLVDYSVSSPSAMRLVLAGTRFSGRYGREWLGICAAGWRWGPA